MLNLTYLAEETEPTEEEIKILDAFEMVNLITHLTLLLKI